MKDNLIELEVVELEERVEFGICGGGGGGDDGPGTPPEDRCQDITWPDCKPK